MSSSNASAAGATSVVGTPPVRGVILAGGQASRFGGAPKGLERVGGVRILDQLVETFLAAFGHLHGYSAIYYTYMWSLVIAKDLFSRFDGDLMNGATANDYRREILAPGGSRDAAELVRGFLGRDYATDAWVAWLNR